MKRNSKASEPGAVTKSPLPTGYKASEHSTTREREMQGRSKADAPRSKKSQAGGSSVDSAPWNAAGERPEPKSRSHEPAQHAGSSMGTTFTEDSFDAGRTAKVGSMGSTATEPAHSEHTSHDGSRSTDGGRTAKGRGDWIAPSVHTGNPLVGTGHRKGHPGQPKKTGSMAKHTDEHKPASY